MDGLSQLLPGNWTTEFYVGAVLVVLLQADKFNRVNISAEKYGATYSNLLSGLPTRNFATIASYSIGLTAYCFASLMIFAVLCQLSPTVLAGLFKVFGLELTIDSKIPYPLYVAAAYIGLTQPDLFLAKFGDAQRDFFHARISVPRRVIDQTARITSQVEAAPLPGGRPLENALLLLFDTKWQASSVDFVDLTFLKNRLQRTAVPTDMRDLKPYLAQLPDNLLESTGEQVIATFLMAAVRRSGSRGSKLVFDRLGATWEKAAPTDLAYFGGVILVLFLSLAVISLVVDAAREPAHALMRVSAGLWPPASDNFQWIIEGVAQLAIPGIVGLMTGLFVWSKVYSETLPQLPADPPGTFAFIRGRAQFYAAPMTAAAFSAFVAGLFLALYLYGLHQVEPGLAAIVRTVLLTAFEALIPLGAALFVFIKLEEVVYRVKTTDLLLCVGAVAAWTTVMAIIDALLSIRVQGWTGYVSDLPVYEVVGYNLVMLAIFFSFTLSLNRPAANLGDALRRGVPA